MNDNKNESRSIILIIVGYIQKACLIFFIGSLIGIFVSGIFETKHDNWHPWVTSNQGIVNSMTRHFYKEDSLNRRAVKVLRSIRYYAPNMDYVVYSSAGDRMHHLDYKYGCLNDTFPELILEMRKLFPKNWREAPNFLIRKGTIIYVPNNCWLDNCNYKTPYLAFSTKPDKELLNDFKNYKLYDTTDTVSNEYKGGWLKRIEKDWYIVSPDSTQAYWG